MNPRRVHELMRQHFPEFSVVAYDWVTIPESNELAKARIRELLITHIDEPVVVVQVHRKLGDLLPVDEAVAFICAHIGEGQIRISNPEFNAFVVVALNGVATGWREKGSSASLIP